jgi:hypothetical protein
MRFQTLIVQIVLLLRYAFSIQHNTSRRILLNRFLLTSGIVSSTCHIGADSAHAAQGAAEYDLEYYMRDLFQGNPRQGTRAASVAPPAPPPRVLMGPLQPLLLQDDVVSCIPYRVLSNLVSNNEKSKIMERFDTIRTAASRSFQSRAPWQEPRITDQYFFDLSCYAFWRTAAELLPDYKMRDTFARTIGRELYNTPSLFKSKPLKNEMAPLTSTIESMKEILDLFTNTQYCTSYRMTRDKEDDSDIFDKLDDTDLSAGVSVNCLVSIFNPASLGASLQITGEQSRFIPDFVGTTLAAMWESVGINASYEIYFVDPEYRPNPKDYFPNEELLQFTLTIKS